ncbi:MAG: hypothetical protein CMH46_10750 [Muricauda sp.]|nr:hypothetical protein [Allomuricauda sp.]
MTKVLAIVQLGDKLEILHMPKHYKTQNFMLHTSLIIPIFDKIFCHNYKLIILPKIIKLTL